MPNANLDEALARARAHLAFLYGDDVAARTLPALEAAIARTRAALADRPAPPELTERDALLITYGDSVRSPGEAPLRTLERFLREQLGDLVSGVHILPFYPFTSDDGFSVVDYRAIDPALGEWADVERLAQGRRVMFDAVINHISQASEWFQGFLRGEEPYDGYFIVADPEWDLRAVVRPRTLPLLTEVETAHGPRHVWTTFSTDQIDLNYANPDVLVAMADLLLFYAERGASLIRLDAIAYLWKEPGTPSIHLPQTHAVVKLLRAVLDAAAPHVLLITETNVPHADNISYFGERLPETGRSDEAQLVYQFPLAPLVLHAFASGSAALLSQWAAGLGDVPGSFFNFLASHDGIGVLPALGLLEPEEVAQLAERTLAHGGRVSYRSLPDGSESAYELNITFYDALNDPAQPEPETDVARFLASQAIMLSLAGLPGIYFQSLFGARSCRACFETTGRARSLNREKFDYDALRQELTQPDNRAARVFAGYSRLLRARGSHPAFHPATPQEVLEVEPGVFGLLRRPQGWPQADPNALLCLINVTSGERSIYITLDDEAPRVWTDLLSGEEYAFHYGALTPTLAPYQVLWLAAQPETAHRFAAPSPYGIHPTDSE